MTPTQTPLTTPPSARDPIPIPTLPNSQWSSPTPSSSPDPPKLVVQGGDDIIFARAFVGCHLGGGRGEGNPVLKILLCCFQRKKDRIEFQCEHACGYP